ncbi:MAG TPA: hypothetical protein PK228_09150 [Saprospiraceae bacterium]|nr:hypothetical protein [Saprospiraceae bacterium]
MKTLLDVILAQSSRQSREFEARQPNRFRKPGRRGNNTPPTVAPRPRSYRGHAVSAAEYAAARAAATAAAITAAVKPVVAGAKNVVAAVGDKGKTLYLPINLGSSGREPVGIYVPKGFTPGKAVDFILYLHGHKAGCRPVSTNMKDYWRDKQFPLREKVQAAQKNIILIAPTLGSLSEVGWLETPGGFDRFWERVITGLKQQSVIPDESALGNLFLSGHSGAGSPMRRILNLSDGTVKNIREVWVFDGLYYAKGGTPDGLVKSWEEWAKKNPSVSFFTYYNEYKDNSCGKDESTKRPCAASKALKNKNLPNVTAIPTLLKHCQIPGAFIEERTKGAALLANLS